MSILLLWINATELHYGFFTKTMLSLHKYNFNLMCFSAAASFSASAVLASAGVFTTSRVKNIREVPIAIIPLIFAIQQFIEGVLWVSLKNSGGNSLLYSAFFLFFALFWWPFFTPIMTMALEKNQKRKTIMFVIWLFGIYIGVTQYLNFLNNPTVAKIMNHCIYYDVHSPLKTMAVIMYLTATVGVSMLSSHKAVREFGSWLGIFAAISAYAYFENFTSVWCFFGAILSFILCIYFKKTKR